MTLEAVLAIIGTMFGTGGSLAGIFYFKQNKRLKKNEADVVQYEAESTFIENTNKAIDVYKEAIEFQKAQKIELEEYHNSRYERLSEAMTFYKMQVEDYKKDAENNHLRLKQLSTKVNNLEKKIEVDKALLCYNHTCEIRQNEK